MSVRNTHTRWGYIAQFLYLLIVALMNDMLRRMLPFRKDRDR